MREDILIREARIRDAPYIKQLWQRVFNDTDDVIAAFFEVYVDVRLCVLAQLENRLAAFGLLLPVGEFVAPEAPPRPCAMMYAVGADPELRGLGCASLVTRELLTVGKKHGFEVIALRPATPTLFDFYGKNGFYEAFYCRERRVSANEIEKAASIITQPVPERVSPEAYKKRRESLLGGVAHVAFDKRALAFQERINPGGGLFFVGDSCAAVEITHSGGIRIAELIGAGEGALAALAAMFPAKQYLVREPDFSVAPPQSARFGMANIDAAAYMGFTFG
ncbi:MAG: GNAT family N-acetyltransferase [Oscillospiraceae bacterium]|jgi:ribosomal protein S18 acetylase RimI-like enzyme|nr:GNAT family N-acetyltransferase [Oscillospiraceae bacterium]